MLLCSIASLLTVNTRSVVVSCWLWVMGFLLHGEKIYGYGKEAYQQRPVDGINLQA